MAKAPCETNSTQCKVYAPTCFGGQLFVIEEPSVPLMESWLADGEVYEIFKEVCEDIENCLRTHPKLAKRKPPCGLCCCMIGPVKLNAIPVIVFSCNDGIYREKAFKILKKQRFLKNFFLRHSDFQMIQLDKAPQLVTESTTEMSPKSIEIWLPDKAGHNPYAVLRMNNGLVLATLGGLVRRSGKVYGLTASHALWSGARMQPKGVSESYSLHESKHEADESDTESISTIGSFKDESIDEDQQGFSELSIKAHTKTGDALIFKTSMDFDDGDSDWLLCEMDQLAQASLLSLHSFDLKEATLPNMPEGSEDGSMGVVVEYDLLVDTEVLVHTARREPMPGTIVGNHIGYRPQGSDFFLDLTAMKISEQLEPGDCGSWVLAEKGRWCGQVVAIQPGSDIAYFLPASKIVSDLNRRINHEEPPATTFIAGVKPGDAADESKQTEGVNQEQINCLADLCKSGKLEDVRRLLEEKKVEADRQDDDGRTALSYAAEAGHVEIAQLLLSQKGIEINTKDRDGSTPLLYAAKGGHVDILSIMLELEGIDIDACNVKGCTPLYYAISKGHEQAFRLLLEKGADLTAGGWNLLHVASTFGHLQIVQKLLDDGADANATFDEYGNALYAASASGHEHVVRLLLDKVIDMNACSGSYGNALQAASLGGHARVVLLLLAEGADPNVQGGVHGNALQAASWKGHESIVEMLLMHSADVNAENGCHGTALLAACKGGHGQVVQLLLDCGADTNPHDGLYGTAVEYASAGGHEHVVYILSEEISKR